MCKLNSRLDKAEVSINELEDSTQKLCKKEHRRGKIMENSVLKKRVKLKEDTTVRRFHLCLIRVPERKGVNKGQRIYVKS